MNHSNEFHLDKLLILLIDQSEAPREAEAQTHDMFEVTVSVTFVASVSQTDISNYRKVTCLNFKGCLIKPPLKLGLEWAVTSQ